MTRTITVPIGPNAYIDGGPFLNFEGSGFDGKNAAESGELHGHDRDGYELSFTMAEIQDALGDEMRDGQPLRLNTGDTDDPVGTVDLPLVDGYIIEAHALDGRAWTFGDLQTDKLSLRSAERSIKALGATIE